MQIVLDRQAAARYGLNADDVSDLIESGIAGGPQTQLFIGDRVYNIALRLQSISRDDPDKIANLLLTTPTGAQVALSQIAQVSLRSGESTIAHEFGHRHMTVKLNLRDRDLGTFLDEAQPAIDNGVHYDHAKYQVRWGGQFENQNRAQKRLFVIMPIVLSLMFVLLFGAFGTLRHPTLIMLAVPLAAVGGFLALHLRGMTLNVSSGVGFIALFGVAIQNGIIMVSNLNDWRERGGDLLEAIVHGAAERFRPVLMTATVAILGLLPAALTHSLGSDVQRPLSSVIIGGLLTATPLTLFLLPALYFMVESWSRRRVLNHPPLIDTSLDDLTLENT